MLTKTRSLTIIKAFAFCLLLTVFFVASAKADSNTVYIDGSYAFADNGYGIPPYGGTLGGQSESFFCVDFAHDITAGMSWQVNITNLVSSTGYGNTLLGKSNPSNAETIYLEMAYLIVQMVSDPNQKDKAEDQWAIWALSSSNPSAALNPYGTNQALINLAAANANPSMFSGWEILSSTGSQGQEFLVRTPEPSTLLCCLVGILALLILKHRTLLS